MSAFELPPVQTGPAVWTGPEMADRGDWVVQLASAQVAELEAASRSFIARGGDLTRLSASDFALPRLGRMLVELRRELLDGRGFALVRGLPIERLSRREAATIFMGIGAHLGSVRSQNAKGHLLGHVCNLGLSSADPRVRIYQTHERQTFHTDSCDVVGLLCLSDARQGGDSLLASAAAIFNALRASRPDLLARLFQPMAHDRRGEVPPGQQLASADAPEAGRHAIRSKPRSAARPDGLR